MHREENRAANHLANVGHDLALGLHVFLSICASLFNVLADDRLGLAQVRDVPCYFLFVCLGFSFPSPEKNKIKYFARI